MNGVDLAMYADSIGFIVSALLTIIVLSFAFGDNVLFRLVMHIFIGMATGYAVVVIVLNVILYRLIFPILQSFGEGGDPLKALSLVGVPILLGLWLLTKIFPRSRLGNPVVGFLVGVGAATAIGGAVMGTIFPQTIATASAMGMSEVKSPSILNAIAQGLVIMLGTAITLASFHFGARATADGSHRRNPIIETIGLIGQILIAITLGALFAGVFAATLMALVERIQFLWDLIWNWSTYIHF